MFLSSFLLKEAYAHSFQVTHFYSLIFFFFLSSFWQIYAVSITIRIVVSRYWCFEQCDLTLNATHIDSSSVFVQFGFMFIALIWKFDFSPFMVLIIAILNDG